MPAPPFRPAFVGACREATGGNPLLLRELLGMLFGEGVAPTAANVGAVKTMGPSAVARSVMFRLSRLSGDEIEVAKAVAAVKGTTVIGGGDSIAAVAKAGVTDRITHISTGGGASLEFLGGRTLPGVAALPDQ